MLATELRRPETVLRQRGEVLVAGEVIDAITMPAPFGALVQAELEIMMLAGTVVADPDGSWTFLTRRANTAHPSIPADLLPLGVRAVPAGGRVDLPAGFPPDRTPAIWSTVVGAARRVAYRRSSAS